MAMNEKIVVQSVTESRSTSGAVTDSWATFMTSWADVQQVSGSEQFASDMTIYNDIKTFVIHYQEGKNVTPKMRISYDEGYYYITSVSHREHLKTTLTAVRNDDD